MKCENCDGIGLVSDREVCVPCSGTGVIGVAPVQPKESVVKKAVKNVLKKK